MSLVRRIAAAIFVLALIVGAQAHVMPMMPSAKADVGMAGMTQGSPGMPCKDCDHSGAAMKAGCTVACAPAAAVAPPLTTTGTVVHTIAWLWTDDSASGCDPAPELSPPRR
jgi:hypothetical protein